MQVIKAGIMEIGDIFVINKCDRPGSDKIESELMILQQISDTDDIEKPIVKIVAPKNFGIPELYKVIIEKQKLQQQNSILKSISRARINNEIISNLQQSIISHIKNNVVSDKEIELLINDVFDNKSDPMSISLSLY